MKVNLSMKHSLTMTLAVLVSLGVAAAARGATEVEKQSLAGLSGVRVMVEQIDLDAERDGLTRTGLQTDVELWLRQAGIRVLTEEEWKRTPGRPWLHLWVTTHKRVGLYGVYAYSVQLQLYQRVRLDRAPSLIAIGATWVAKGGVGTVGETKLRTVRENVRDLVDQFINDYLAANPKRQ